MNNFSLCGKLVGRPRLYKDVHGGIPICEFKIEERSNRLPIICRTYNQNAIRVQNSCIEGDYLELIGSLKWTEKSFYMAAQLVDLIDKKLPDLIIQKEEIEAQIKAFKQNVQFKRSVNIVACWATGIEEFKIEEKANELIQCILNCVCDEESAQNIANIDYESFRKLLSQMYYKDTKYNIVHERDDIRFLDKYVHQWLRHQNGS